MIDLAQPIQKTLGPLTVGMLDKPRRRTALLGHRYDPFIRILNGQDRDSSSGGCASCVRITGEGTAVVPEEFEEWRERYR
jgi:hypothetical protein